MLRFSLLAVSLALIAGCGGGDDEEGESQDPTAAFVEEASAICAAGARETAVAVQLEAGRVQVDEGTALAQVIRFEEVLGGTNDELAALEPPAELADGYADFVDVRNQLNAVRAEVIEALEAGDSATADAAYKRIATLDAETFGLAEGLGLEGCDSTLPPEQEAEVEETVAEIASSLDGEHVCEELLYPEFIELTFGNRGGLEGCIKFQENPANVSEVSFESISGFDSALAIVIYTKIGGSDDGLRIRERLFFDEELGHWRLWDGAGLN